MNWESNPQYLDGKVFSLKVTLKNMILKNNNYL